MEKKALKGLFAVELMHPHSVHVQNKTLKTPLTSIKSVASVVRERPWNNCSITFLPVPFSGLINCTKEEGVSSCIKYHTAH